MLGMFFFEKLLGTVILKSLATVFKYLKQKFECILNMFRNLRGHFTCHKHSNLCFNILRGLAYINKLLLHFDKHTNISHQKCFQIILAVMNFNNTCVALSDPGTIICLLCYKPGQLHM